MAISLGLFRMFREALAAVKSNPIIDSAIRLSGAVEVDPECLRDDLIEAFRVKLWCSRAREMVAKAIVEFTPEQNAVEALLYEFGWKKANFAGMKGFDGY